MEKDLIIEDILERADKLSDSSLLVLLKRVDNVAYVAEDKEMDLALDVDLNTYNNWTSKETAKSKKDLEQIRRINKLLKKNHKELYITYYPTEDNQSLKLAIENTNAINESRKLRGYKDKDLLPVPTQESAKVIHAVGYWTEEQARRYGYSTRKSSDIEIIELDKLKPLIEAGYLDKYGQPIITDKKKQAVLAYFVAEIMGRTADCWVYIKKIWGDKYNSLPTHLSRAREKNLYSEYLKVFKEVCKND